MGLQRLERRANGDVAQLLREMRKGLEVGWCLGHADDRDAAPAHLLDMERGKEEGAVLLGHQVRGDGDKWGVLQESDGRRSTFAKVPVADVEDVVAETIVKAHQSTLGQARVVAAVEGVPRVEHEERTASLTQRVENGLSSGETADLAFRTGRTGSRLPLAVGAEDHEGVASGYRRGHGQWQHRRGEEPARGPSRESVHASYFLPARWIAARRLLRYSFTAYRGPYPATRGPAARILAAAMRPGEGT